MSACAGMAFFVHCMRNQSPVTSHQSPVTSHQSPVTSHQSPVTSYQSLVTSHQSLVSHNIRDGVNVVDWHEMSAGSVDLAEGGDDFFGDRKACLAAACFHL